MTDLWLISVPLDKTSITNVGKLKHTIAKTNLASCFMFSLPDLTVSFSSQRGAEKVPQSECRQEHQSWESVIKVKKKKKIIPESRSVCASDLLRYVTRFQWDKAKYPTAMPLSCLADIINKEVSQVAAELKSRAAAYNSVKTSLQSFEYKLHGNLQTRSLCDIIKKEDLVVSEYLTTLLLLVTRLACCCQLFNFLSFIRKLYEDAEGGVFSVTLFKRAVCNFKTKAQESKFIVREYSFDLEEKRQQEMKQLNVRKKEQYGVFVRWLKLNFSQVFVAWIHLKALRIFVESALRYGLPVSYQALLLQTDSKRSKKLGEELSSLFMHLDPTLQQGCSDIPGLCPQEYSSYICFHINTNVLEFS
uniref:V-type proton ATPase subunit C n=1 Tax=Mola mola TaxID=94237 RepID=A0A3Q3W3K1_MOLML